jgi:hypothetical protein
MRKNGNNLKSIGIAALAVGLLIGGAFAFVSYANYDTISVYDGGVVNIQNAPPDGMLGGTTNLDSLALDSDLTVTNNAIVGGTLAVVGDATFSGGIGSGIITNQWLTGSCTDASTTLFAHLNPFGQTVTVDEFYIDIVNGTSSAIYYVGTTTSAFPSSAPWSTLVDTITIATTTNGTATTTERVYIYAMNATVTKGYSGFTAPGTKSAGKILWKAGQYITGYVTSLYTAGITNPANWADCSYRIHVTY